MDEFDRLMMLRAQSEEPVMKAAMHRQPSFDELVLNAAKIGDPVATDPAIEASRRAADAMHKRLSEKSASVRTFSTGATRDTDEGKLDFEGFLSPRVLKAFAEYMHEKRKMPDGSMRDSDNWQKGIPLDAYMKSMWRHFFDTWESHRNGEIYGDVIKNELLALLFNVQGYLHEILKAQRARAL